MNIDAIIARVAGVSLITPDRLKNLCRALMATTEIPGCMAELGVYRGGSAYVISSVCPNKTLHLFDTFAGLPYEELRQKNPTNHLKLGQLSCSESEALGFLNGLNIATHAGLFPYSAVGLESLVFSFVHVDCDLYQSAKDAIEWFWPRLSVGGVMFFDDYGCDFTGVTDAVNESFWGNRIVKQTDANGFSIGCLVVKSADL